MNIYTTNTQTTSEVTLQVPDILSLTSKSGILLKPQITPPNNEGVLYYDINLHILRYRNHAAWHDLTLELGAANSLADKRIAMHIGSGSYRATDAEHMYLSSNAGTNVWQAWSSDGFIDFRQPYTFKIPITFNSTVSLTKTTTMSGKSIIGVMYPALPSDMTTKQYVDNQARTPTPSDRGPLGVIADALLADTIAQVNTEHNKLSKLWADRKAFRNGSTQYDTDPSNPTYWSGAGLKQAMITATRRLKNAGRI